MTLDPARDESVVRSALARGLLTAADVERCRAIQDQLARRGRRAFLAQILLKKGLLDRATLRDLLMASTSDSTRTCDGDEPSAAAAATGPGRTVGGGRYEVGEALGEGAMAVVHRARDRQLGRDVALKILKRAGRAMATRARRFEREARAVARLDHPAVVRVFDVLDDGDELCLVMELVEGSSLEQLLATGRPAVRDLVELVEGIARGVEAAHSAGIIHRDLKPSNILVTDAGRPKVVDFGLARLVETEATALTRSGAQLGTPLYMAPEQVAGQASRIGPPTDVFALGGILYQALTGQPPFLGVTASEVFARIQYAEPEPPSRRRAGVDRALDAIVLTSLDKEPARRYPTAGALADDLARHLAGEPVAARPAGPVRRLARRVRRRPALLLGALAVLVAVAGAIVGLRVLEFRRARQEALAARDAGDWAACRVAADRALTLGHDPELAELAADAARRLEEVERRTAAELTRGEAYRRLQERAAPVEALLREARPFFYVEGADIRGRIEKVERALEDLAAIAGSEEFAGFHEVWELLGIGWFVVGHDERAEVHLLRARELGATGQVDYHLGRIYLERSMKSLLATESGQAAGAGREEADEWSARAARHLAAAADGSGIDEIEGLAVRAYAALAAGENQEVADLCAEGIEAYGRQPGVEEFWNLLGWVEGGNDRAVQIERYSRALAIRPHYAWAYFMRAAAWMMLGRHEEAIADCDRALAIEPGFVEALNNRATCRNRLGRFREALADLDLLLSFEPGYVIALVNRALAREALGDLDGAMDDLDEAIRRQPDLAASYNNRGVILLGRGDLERAMADFDRSLALHPDQVDARVNRAKALLAGARIDEARAELDRAVAASPAHSALRVERAILRMATGDLAGARSDLDEALRLDPTNALARANRGTVNLSEGRFDDAFTDSDEAIRLDPRIGAAFTNRGSVHLQRRQLDLALADFDQACRLSPGAPEPFASRAMVHHGKGDLDAAEADLVRSLAIAPPGWPYRAQVERMLSDLRDER